jgi:predicted nucleic-acid-binding Zn-ribbon protein
MRNGTCPKCKSEEVYGAYSKSSLDAGLHADDGQILFHIHSDKGFLGDSTFLYLETYVCRACGYLEMYVPDLQELEKLPGSTNWQKVKQ